MQMREKNADSAYCRHMVHVWFLHHRAHRVLHRTIRELVVTVLVPYYFEVKVWSVHTRF
jgi:hypothetical protein